MQATNIGFLPLLACFLFLIFKLCVTNAKLVLKPDEIKALAVFRPLVQDILTHEYQTTDSYLIRWLKAKKLNVKDSVELLSQAQKWRKESKIDTIQNETFPEFDGGFAWSDEIIDKEGRTVIIFNIGDYDLRKVVISGKSDRYVRFTIQRIERAVSSGAERVYRSNGTLSDSRIVVLNDFHGFNLRKVACLLCVNIYGGAAVVLDKYYPGIVAVSIYINVPRIALPMVEVLKSFLSTETKEAIHTYGSNRTEWSTHITRLIPADQLPYRYGGSKKN